MTSPQGFLSSADAEPAQATWDGNRWTIAGTPFPEESPGEAVAPLRAHQSVRLAWPAGISAHAAPTPDGETPYDADARRSLDAVLTLAAAGVPLHAETVPRWLAADDPALAELLTSTGWLEPETDTSGVSVAALRREEHSVRLRRHALAARRTRASVSVIMASRRPSMAGWALAQIARQRHVDVEVVFAAHGYPADVVRRAAKGLDIPVEVIEADGDTVFGDVLNEAARRASGDLLAKWDDDDWYGPEHLADLLLARSYSGADIVGTTAEFFHLEPLNLTIRRTDYKSEVWNRHVAGGTIMLDRAVFTGFPSVPRAVDEGMLTAADAAGARIYRTHGLGYMLRRSTADRHTWRLPLAHFLKVATNQWRGVRPSHILEPAH
ncbi:glycosyltransferase family 2 protein [Microtetraspora malaysiensis]|uniref:Glycosyltransferase family 2 protein n=1 Tax=Microtetraspora malaysiensis TaxID=161358 RepID=A0ABW6SRT2_9ACTN